MPLFILWDGIVSVLRAYTIKELKQLVSEVNNHVLFEREIDVVKQGPNEVLYLLGIPRK